MFFMTAKLSKKKLLLAAAVLVLLILAAVLLLSRDAGEVDAEELLLSTNAERVEYLRSYGWEVDPEALETLQLLLPDVLPESYRDYNDLQKQQGFNLEDCLGKQITRYTYRVVNYPNRPDGVQANLYICENRPVAGDVIASGADGFQSGLAYPETST